MSDIIKVVGLNKKFFNKNAIVNAIDDVSFSLPKGKIIGLIGESGSGKTTVGRTLMNLHRPDSGSILINDQEYGTKLSRRDRKHLYQNMQMIFQDPYSSLNGQKNIYGILKEALIVKEKDDELLADLLKDRLDVLKFYKGTLSEYYWSLYWSYRNFANKNALQAYDVIKTSLEEFKFNSRKTLLGNYLLLRSMIFEEKFNANSKIMDKLNAVAFNVRDKYNVLRDKVYNQTFDDFDERKLSQAQSKLADIEHEIKASKEVQKIIKELDKINVKIVHGIEQQKMAVIRSKSNIKSSITNLHKEARIIYGQKLLAHSRREYKFHESLIIIKKIMIKALVKVKAKNLIFDDLIADINRQQLKLIQNHKTPDNQIKTIGRPEQIKLIDDVVNIFVKIAQKLAAQKKVMVDKIKAQQTSIQNELARAKKVSAKRNNKQLNAAHKKAKADLEIAIQENQKKIAEYQKQSNIKSEQTIKVNKAKTENDTAKIIEAKTVVDAKVTELVKMMFKTKFKKNSDFKSTRFEKRHVKKMYKIDLYRNASLEKQIKVVFKELKSVQKFIALKDESAKTLNIFEKLELKKILVRAKIFETLKVVGLSSSHAYSYPHEFSGGMRQRVGIARAIISDPKIIIADEPIAALDLSIQAQIVNLLNDIIKKRQLSMIFIAHDLSMIEYTADRLLIMHLGKVVEYGITKSIFQKPIHPYTKNLINAMPSLENVGKGFKAQKFSQSYRDDYSIFNAPAYAKITKDHFVLGLEKQIKLWKNTKTKRAKTS